MLNYYGRLASEVYDLDKPIGHSFGDVEYYAERLKTCEGPILEPAVGTGRVFIPLLEMGLQIEGFDLSKDMLSICDSYCKEKRLKSNLFEASMESFSRNIKYDAIIVPTGSFLLVHQRGESIKALKNFYHHLTSGGKLIIDLILPDHFSIGKRTIKSWTTLNGDIITSEDTLTDVYFIKQYIVQHIKYEKWRDGVLIQSELEQYPLRWYSVEEFKTILEILGFKKITISSDYEHNQYPTHSNQIITFEAVADK
jgi:SAM-dependent methyltransferase